MGLRNHFQLVPGLLTLLTVFLTVLIWLSVIMCSAKESRCKWLVSPMSLQVANPVMFCQCWLLETGKGARTCPDS